MASGIRKTPEHLRMSRQDHQRAIETSRMLVEQEKWSSHCYAYNPDAAYRPGTERIGVVQITVPINPDFCRCGCLVGQGERGFAIVIPDNYPNQIPKIYPDKWTIPHDDSSHLYRDLDGKVHICTMFKGDWCRNCSISGMMVLASKWLHKYLHWNHTGIWPGKSQPHCRGCGQNYGTCKC
jgi:hypothetical protein